MSETPVWRCFHCCFETTNEDEAAAHFGDDEHGPALCQQWNAMTDDARVAELQRLRAEIAVYVKERLGLFQENESLAYQVSSTEQVIASRFKGCRTINDVLNAFHFQEGALLAERERVSAQRAVIAKLVEAGRRIEQAGKESNDFAGLWHSEPESWDGTYGASVTITVGEMMSLMEALAEAAKLEEQP